MSDSKAETTPDVKLVRNGRLTCDHCGFTSRFMSWIPDDKHPPCPKCESELKGYVQR